MSMETKQPQPHQGGQGAGPGAGYEQRDANIPDLLKFGFWMAVVIAVTLFAMKWTFNYMERTQTVQRLRLRHLPGLASFRRARACRRSRTRN